MYSYSPEKKVNNYKDIPSVLKENLVKQKVYSKEIRSNLVPTYTDNSIKLIQTSSYFSVPKVTTIQKVKINSSSEVQSSK